MAPAVQAALVFSFSFDNDIDDPGKAIDGTVTGRIFGLVDNTTSQAATSVVIDSFPSGLGGVVDEAEVLDWTFVDLNNFDVAGGEITLADFSATLLTDPVEDMDQLCFRTIASGTCSGYVNVFTMDQVNTYVANNTVGGVTFDQVVPIPGAVWLFGSGLMGLIGISRHKKA